jgi:UDP-N-acetylglucosamine 2-epimerase
VIKASMLIEAAAARWPLVTVDTGQHYDYELNAVFYEQLGVPRPHHFLEVGSGRHALQTAAVLTRAAEVFESAKPWAVVVIGDTNSTLGCALAATQMRIPVVHVEAGLRSNDRAMAEEINRRVVDAIGDLLCAPSQAAVDELRRENQPGLIALTGDAIPTRSRQSWTCCGRCRFPWCSPRIRACVTHSRRAGLRPAGTFTSPRRSDTSR